MAWTLLNLHLIPPGVPRSTNAWLILSSDRDRVWVRLQTKYLWEPALHGWPHLEATKGREK